MFPCSFPNTTTVLNNNNDSDSDTLKRLQNPLYDEMPVVADREGEEPGPTYEIIPLMANVNKRGMKEAAGRIPTDQFTFA